METTQNKLEKLCDIMTEDIFNDIEYAKSIIDEAGYDHKLSMIEAKKKIKEIQDYAVKQMNQSLVNEADKKGMSMDMVTRYQYNMELTIFNIDILDNIGNKFNVCFEGNIRMNGKDCNSINEEKLQLN